MTEKRFTLVKCYNEQWGVVDKSLQDIDQLVLIATSKSGTLYLVNELNRLNDENEQLKSDKLNWITSQQELECLTEENTGLKLENEQLKQFISKIDFAIIRKYDNSLENLLDEIYDGEYNNWIEKQLLRAKKLNGDVE